MVTNLICDSLVLAFADAIAPRYRFERDTGRYRSVETGRFASRTAVIQLARENVSRSQRSLTDLASEVWSGRISTREFQQQAAEALKQIHVQSAIVGANGIDKMQPEDWLAVARRLKAQYHSGKDPDTGDRFGLKVLAQRLRDGEVMSEAMLRQSLRLFAQSGMGSFHETQRAIAIRENNAEYALRILGIAEHCGDCVDYASRGVVPIADAIVPGDRCRCHSNCKCSLRYLTREEAIAMGLTEG